jgi:hypothetical protein
MRPPNTTEMQRLLAELGDKLSRATATAVADAIEPILRRLRGVDGKLDFLLRRTHSVSTAQMAMMRLLFEKGVFSQTELVNSAHGYEAAVQLDNVMKMLTGFAEAAKKRAERTPAPSVN